MLLQMNNQSTETIMNIDIHGHVDLFDILPLSRTRVKMRERHKHMQNVAVVALPARHLHAD
jgi:hypothetical protein